MPEQTNLKVVIDTNIFISGLISTTGSPANLLDKWEEGNFTLIISQEIIDEFVEVVNRPKIKEKYKLSDQRIEKILNSIYTLAEIVPGLYKVKKLEDVKDDKFLACALEGKVDYLVTGDADLRRLKYYRGVQIVSVDQLLGKL